MAAVPRLLRLHNTAGLSHVTLQPLTQSPPSTLFLVLKQRSLIRLVRKQTLRGSSSNRGNQATGSCRQPTCTHPPTHHMPPPSCPVAASEAAISMTTNLRLQARACLSLTHQRLGVEAAPAPASLLPLLGCCPRLLLRPAHRCLCLSDHRALCWRTQLHGEQQQGTAATGRQQVLHDWDC